MHKVNNILLLADKSEKIANLRFLLRLSSIKTVHIADDTEAFNLLVQRQNSPQPFDLLLVVNANNQRPILQLINAMERNNAMLPILLLNRQEIALAEIDCHDQLKSMIRQCTADATHSRLLSVFATFPETASAESDYSPKGVQYEYQEPQHR